MTKLFSLVKTREGCEVERNLTKLSKRCTTAAEFSTDQQEVTHAEKDTLGFSSFNSHHLEEGLRHYQRECTTDKLTQHKKS